MPKTNQKKLIITLVTAVVAVAIITAVIIICSNASCSDEKFLAHEITLEYPKAEGRDIFTPQGAASDNYIMSVRNKQIGLFERQPAGAAKIGFYDTGRATPDLMYAHGDNFFAVTKGAATTELRMYPASSATASAFEPVRTLVFSGVYLSAEVHGDMMYLIISYNERYSAEGNAPLFTDNGQKRDITASSVDGYDYRGFIVCEVDMRLCTASRAPVYICGLSPRQISVGSNYIYTRFYKFARSDNTVNKVDYVHAMHSVADFALNGTLTDIRNEYAFDGNGGRLTLLSEDVTNSVRKATSKSKFNISVYSDALKKLGSYSYTTAEYATSTASYGLRYVLDEYSMVIRTPISGSSAITTVMDYSDPKKITKSETTSAYSDRQWGLIIDSGITLATERSSTGAQTQEALLSTYDFRADTVTEFESGAVCVGTNIDYRYENGSLYFASDDGFYLYNKSGGKWKLDKHIDYAEVENALVGDIPDFARAAVSRTGDDYTLFYRGLACTDGFAADLRNMFTVTFDTSGAADIQPLLIEKGGKVTREKLESIASTLDEGLNFVRWEIVSGSRLYNIDGDITLRAVWDTSGGNGNG